MSELFPYSTQPPEVAALAKIPLPEIYRLVDKAPFEQAQALASEFGRNAASIIGDVMVIKNWETIASADMPSTSVVIFNGSIPGIRTLQPPHEAITNCYSRNWSSYRRAYIYSLSEDQTKKMAKSPVSSLLAKLGISSAVTAPAVYEFSDLTNQYIGSPTGIALGAASYLVASRFSNKRRAKNAEQILHNFRNYAAREEHGAVSFYRFDGRKMDQLPSIQKFKMSIDRDIIPSTIGKEVTDHLSEWSIPPGVYIYNQHGSFDISIDPGVLIETLLKNDNDPTDFWITSLGEHAQNMSSAQKKLVRLEQQIELLEERELFTGIETPSESRELNNALIEQQQILLSNALLAAEQASKRRSDHTEAMRLNRTCNLIQEITGATLDESHKYELHIQEMITILSISLTQLNIDQKDSDKIVTEIKEYVDGMRNLLTNHMQIEQFYIGIHQKFLGILPNLPKWEAVASRFTALDKTIVS